GWVSPCVKCAKVSAWMKCEMEVVLNQKAVFAMPSPGFLANRQRPRRCRAVCLPSVSKRRSARCWRLRTTKDFVCSSLLIDVPWNASCRSCGTDCTPMWFPENIDILMQSVLSWLIIFLARISSSIFRWHRLVRHSNFAPGSYYVQFQLAKHA